MRAEGGDQIDVSLGFRLGTYPGLTVVGIALSLALSGCSRIEENYCQLRLPPQAVEIHSSPVSYTVSRRESIAELDARKGAGEGEAVLGLTSTRPVVRVDTVLHVVKVGGGVCARPSVHIEMGYAPLEVAIARELEPGSCRERVTMEHELKHVAAYRSFVPQATDDARNAILAALPPKKVYQFSSMSAAQEYFDLLAQGSLSDAGQEALAGVRARQDEIDTPEEYARVDRACPQP